MRDSNGPSQSLQVRLPSRLDLDLSLTHAVVLYEGNGINLYRDITLSKDYYLYNEEFEVITQHQEDIVRQSQNSALSIHLSLVTLGIVHPSRHARASNRPVHE